MQKPSTNWSKIAVAVTARNRHDAAVVSPSGKVNPRILGVEYDSRRVQPGSLFVAMRGGTTDGNRYLHAALQAGAVAIVTDSPSAFDELARSASHIPTLLVEHGRTALAQTAAEFFGHPESLLRATGVTGTNGKTTTTFLTEALLQSDGRKTVMVGTIACHIAGEVVPSLHTTPEPREMLELMAAGAERGATELVTEVSSHALDQGRVAGIRFDVAVFTNLTQDHLDYHGTMERYLAAKMLLFDGSRYEAPRVAVIHADDPHAPQVAMAAAGAGAQLCLYGRDTGDWRAESIQLLPRGVRFALHSPFGVETVFSPLLGEVNVLNLLAALASASARGVDFGRLLEQIPKLKPVPGRFEPVHSGQPFTVLVDYAHSEDALRNLLPLARRMARDGRVLTVFGCGGDRDRTKRPRMGRAAGEGSDLVIVTSDNPRTEAPESILQEILPGVRETGTAYRVEVDRACAIALAIAEARAGDVVVIAGKGHEKIQILRERTVPFDDVEVAHAALQAAGWHEDPGQESGER